LWLDFPGRVRVYQVHYEKGGGGAEWGCQCTNTPILSSTWPS